MVAAFPSDFPKLASASRLVATEVACAHCSLPVPPGRLDVTQAKQFCCDGCQTVFNILNGAGLTQYYDHRQAAQAKPAPIRKSSRSYQDFDDQSLQEQYCRKLTSGLFRVELFLENVHCSACVWLVERLPRVVPGVASATFDLSRSVLEVTWDASQTALSSVGKVLDSLGYPPHVSKAARTDAERRSGDRSLLLRIGVAGAAAGNVMLMALALYSGVFAGMDAEYVTLFRWASLAIATPTVFWTGSVFFRGALAALRTRVPHMDLPITIGILTGYVGGAVNTFRASGEVYFDSLCTLIFLLLVGRWLQRKHQRAASNAADLLSALAPATARIVDENGERELPAGAVAKGDRVRVLPGERIPVDGTVCAGMSAVDAALLTGESVPEEVGIGDRVYAGTVNQTRELVVRTEGAGEQSRVGQLMKSVETAQRERSPIVRLADRVSGYFVVAILIIAALTLVLWLVLDPSRAVDQTVALLVVTCPCALGMATPLAISAALRKAGRAGVLFKGGEFVEQLARPGLILFDKTGTLTEGRLELLAIEGDASILPLVSAAEAHSSHPIASALQRAYSGTAAPDSLSVSERAGGGLIAQAPDQSLHIGSEPFLKSELGAIPEWAHNFFEQQAVLGRTPVLVAQNGVVVTALAFGDKVRNDAVKSLDQLARLGFRFGILSGDHQKVVNSVEKQLRHAFVVALGNVTPENKLAFIKRAVGDGKSSVIMVGDGVNDAAAMAAANVGIAVHGGAEASLSAADVFTTESGLGRIAVAAQGARRTLHVIRRGVLFSLLYNVLGIALAAFGILSPIIAAILMPLSSLTVVTSALRARTFINPKPSPS